MIRIDRHSLPPKEELAEAVPFDGDLVASAVDQFPAQPEVVNRLAKQARDWAGRLSAFSPDSPDLCRGLRLSARASAAIFLAASAQAPVPFALERDEALLSPTGPTGYAHASQWCEGFYLAAACRDRGALDALCATPLDVVRASRTRADEYLYLFVGALQALWKRAPDTGDKLLAALRATDPSELRIAPEDVVLDLDVPCIDLAYRLVARDEAAFNGALEKALRFHARLCGRGQRRDDPAAFLALGPLGLASFAFEWGMRLEVESDYVPRPVVEGACALRRA